MSQHQSAIRWHRAPHPVDGRTYSRNHVAALNGDQAVNVSASVDYKGDPGCADPEQMLVSAVASCHMLTFLAIAEFQGYRVDQYHDDAVGHLEQAEGGGMAITRIELAPRIVFGGAKTPDANALSRLHSGAHKNCFIGKSIKAQVTVVTDAVAA
jgi:organic hydroperoxide reductase OsmC/OhrA